MLPYAHCSAGRGFVGVLGGGHKTPNYISVALSLFYLDVFTVQEFRLFKAHDWLFDGLQ